MKQHWHDLHTHIRLFRSRLRGFGQATQGAAAIEYGLILSLIALVSVAALTNLGESLSNSYQTLASSLDTDSLDPNHGGGGNGGNLRSPQSQNRPRCKTCEVQSPIL